MTQHALRLIPLGIITSPHGIRGEVKIRTFTQNPQDITSYGPLCDKQGRIYEVKITGGSGETLIASIATVKNRNEAELLKNIELCVPRSVLPALPGHTYYHEDLMGIKVNLEDGTPFGVIHSVQNYGAGNILVIKKLNGDEELFPLNEATFPTINIESSTAIIIPPEVIKGE